MTSAAAGQAPGCPSGSLTPHHCPRAGLRPGPAPCLQLARLAGVRGEADGLVRLVEEAAVALARWRGMRPATTAVIDRLTVPLEVG